MQVTPEMKIMKEPAKKVLTGSGFPAMVAVT